MSNLSRRIKFKVTLLGGQLVSSVKQNLDVFADKKLLEVLQISAGFQKPTRNLEMAMRSPPSAALSSFKRALDKFLQSG